MKNPVAAAASFSVAVSTSMSWKTALPGSAGACPSAGAASKNRTSAIPTIRAEHERQCIGRAFVMPVPTDRMSIIRASFAPRGLGGPR